VGEDLIRSIEVFVSSLEAKRTAVTTHTLALVLHKTAFLTRSVSACPAARMELVGSHWTDFHEHVHKYFRKSVEKLQDSLQMDKNNDALTF
jgi:hypothetical protein